MQYLNCACVVALLFASGKGTLDVASPRDEGTSCRCSPFRVPYQVPFCLENKREQRQNSPHVPIVLEVQDILLPDVGDRPTAQS